MLFRSAAILLVRKIGKHRAHKILEEATQTALAQKQSLSQALSEISEAPKYLDSSALESLEAPEQYLGSAEWFRKRLLQSSPEKKD